MVNPFSTHEYVSASPTSTVSIQLGFGAGGMFRAHGWVQSV